MKLGMAWEAAQAECEPLLKLGVGTAKRCKAAAQRRPAGRPCPAGSSSEGARVRFTAKNPEGEVDYDGEIDGDTVQMRFHSHINDARFEHTFHFVPMAKGAP